MSLPLPSPRALGSADDGGTPPPREDPLLPLLASVARGDRKAQRELLELVAPPMLSVLRAVLGPASPDLADQLQESLVAFTHALAGFRGESSVSHFACRIAMKRALDAGRRARVRASVVATAASLPTRPVEPPSAELASARLRAAMRDLMSELPEEQADALAMRAVLGYSVNEISKATRTPLNTVRSRLLAAKKTLKERLLGDATLRELAEVDR